MEYSDYSFLLNFSYKNGGADMSKKLSTNILGKKGGIGHSTPILFFK